MIRTALIYLLTDKCIDRIFDSVESVLLSSPHDLHVGMWLKWIQYNGIRCEVVLNNVVVSRISGNTIILRETPETEYYTKADNCWIEMVIPDGLTGTWKINKCHLIRWEV